MIEGDMHKSPSNFSIAPPKKLYVQRDIQLEQILLLINKNCRNIMIYNLFLHLPCMYIDTLFFKQKNLKNSQMLCINNS